jgi:hypothetical protein
MYACMNACSMYVHKCNLQLRRPRSIELKMAGLISEFILTTYFHDLLIKLKFYFTI